MTYIVLAGTLNTTQPTNPFGHPHIHTSAFYPAAANIATFVYVCSVRSKQKTEVVFGSAKVKL